MKTQKDRRTIAIFKDQFEKLKPLAAKNHRSITGQIRSIIDEWLIINENN